MIWLHWILIIGGSAFLVLGSALAVPALKSRNRPSVDGRIAGHRIGSVYEWKTSRPKVLIRYSYVVEGRHYEGETLSHSIGSPGPSAPTPEEALHRFLADPTMEKWRTGKKVRVYYDAGNPGDSVLEPGSWMLGAGVILMGAGIAFCGVFSRLAEVRKGSSISGDGS